MNTLLKTLAYLMILLAFSQASLADEARYQRDYKAYSSTSYFSKKWDRYVQAGMEAYHGEDYDTAHEMLYKAFNRGCKSPIVLFQLALLNESKGSYYSAIEFYQMAKANFRKANGSHEYSKNFLENYGRALFMSGKKDEAIPLLFKAAKRSKDYQILKLVGMISFERGDTLNALSYFERAVRVKDGSVTNKELIYMYTLLARLFTEKNEVDGATRYYRKVRDLDPTNSEANNFINGIQQQQNKSKNQDKLMDILKDF